MMTPTETRVGYKRMFSLTRRYLRVCTGYEFEVDAFSMDHSQAGANASIEEWGIKTVN
jgi:hypothetical protein